jgi:hypothetical protein
MIERIPETREDIGPWTGTGRFYVIIMMAEPFTFHMYSANGINPTPFDFQDQITTIQWSDFISDWDF